MVWYKQEAAVPGQVAGSLLPTVISNTLLSSHRHNTDKTYSLSSFFYLTASLDDSGKQFTCRVSHKSLKVDIKKSFILTVEGESLESIIAALQYRDSPESGSIATSESNFFFCLFPQSQAAGFLSPPCLSSLSPCWLFWF